MVWIMYDRLSLSKADYHMEFRRHTKSSRKIQKHIAREDSHLSERLLSVTEEDIALPSAILQTNAYASSELWRDDIEFRLQSNKESHTETSTKKEAFAGSVSNIAKIRLETLSSKTASRIIWLTYGAFVLAFLLPYWEHEGYLFTTNKLSGDICSSLKHLHGSVPCTLVDEKHQEAVWNAYVSGIAWRKAAVNLYVNIGIEDRQQADRVFESTNYVLHYDLDIYEDFHTDKKHENILFVSAKNQSVYFRCMNNFPCPKLVLLAMNEDAKKTEFKKSSLWITVRFHGLYPNTIRDRVQYELSYENPSIALGESIIRTIILLASIITLPLWFYKVMIYSCSWKATLQIQKLLLLFGLVVIMWQNPVALTNEWLSSQNVWLYRVSSVCQALAESFFYIFWLQLVDLQGPEHDRRSRIAQKVVFAGALFSLDIGMKSIHTPLFFSDNRSIWRQHLYVFVLLGFIRLSLLLFWIFWIVKSNWRTAAYLRTKPYMSTRFHQLSYRFLVLESILVLLYVFVTCLMQLIKLCYVGIAIGLTAFLQQSAYNFLDFFSDRPTLGRYLFISTYAYLILFVHLPPNNDKRTIRPTFSQQSKEKKTMGKFTASGFDQSFSLETAVWLLDISWQAYFDAPGKPSPSGYGEMDLSSYGIELVAHLRDLVVDTHVLIALSHDKSRLLVAFRGTTSRQNWKSNLRFHQNVVSIRPARARELSSLWRRIRSTLSKIPLCGMALTRVHSGFWKAYVPIRDDLTQVIRLLLDEYPNVSIYVTGHSMGGALAILAAYDFATTFDISVTMYNFGCPRVGNPTFAREYNKYVPNSYRVVMDGDIVPGVPRFWGLYQHVGTEVAMDGDGNLIVDPSFVEKKLHVSTRNKLSSHRSRVYRAALKKCCETLSAV